MCRRSARRSSARSPESTYRAFPALHRLAEPRPNRLKLGAVAPARPPLRHDARELLDPIPRRGVVREERLDRAWIALLLLADGVHQLDHAMGVPAGPRH